MTDDERNFNALLRIIEQALDEDPTSAVYTDPLLAGWLVRDACLAQTPAEREATRERARAFARRMAPVLAGARAEQRIPRSAPRFQQGSAAVLPRTAVADAAAQGCAPRFNLSAAAGAGRELWDEPCDTWIKLPDGLPPSEYVAIGVSGDSMRPFVSTGDTILVRLGGSVELNDVALVRLPGDEYVVKCIDRISSGKVRLLSFNPEYEPVWVRREPGTIVGTVVARFSTA